MWKIHYTVVATILFYCNILFAYGPNEAYEDAMNNDPRIYLLLFLAAISSLPFITYKKYIKLKHGNETNIISKAVKQSLSDCGFFAVTFWVGGIVLIVVSLLIISIISMLSVNMSHVFASFLHSSNSGIIYLLTIIWWVICLVWNINKLED